MVVLGGRFCVGIGALGFKQIFLRFLHLLQVFYSSEKIGGVLQF